ncbi:putative O-linked N-acetylglucosamine transferase, SPINDLY family [Rivularia sp. PCC 7116]|uniref:O-linked N-acetylglucosamine transferase, SPINDLY family protein n=1 Tax=Rivularia sp. PCC 7116 TaxID=373994 RepID=UPI00029F3AF5|nr:O-linked N-acetylglucosamine transferase [Rivularia sp. PCC 7116]AFY56298.1 putative O-linked N-acetylglucosamine transferase, SPINDLY family [Rivularia sp. PCC 7116]
MVVESSITRCQKSQEQAFDYLEKGDYEQAIKIYHELIEIEPDIKSYYWYLGLTLLLQGEEADAQATWMLAMMEGEPEQVELWNDELIEILEHEAQRQIKLENYSTAYLLRQYIQEFAPIDIDNLLWLIQLAIKLELFSGEYLSELEIIHILQNYNCENVDVNLFIQTIQFILDADALHPYCLEFVAACIPYLGNYYKFFAIILVAAVKLAYSLGLPSEAIKLAKICLQINDKDTELLRHLAAFYQKTGNYDDAIATAKYCLTLLQDETLLDKVYGNHLVLKTLINAGGYWEEVQEVFNRHQKLLADLIEEQPEINDKTDISRLLLSGFFFPYLKDNPKIYRQIQSQLATLCQKNFRNYANTKISWYQNRQTTQSSLKSNQRLKIGYISSCFRQHSVGWLARWLFEYHNRKDFELYGYFVNYQLNNDSLQEWYIEQFDQYYQMGISSPEIAKQIDRDEIDILIDLDSLSVDITCEVMALKPAKIQATWLGWDASGLPAIDYFIADSYVLPDNAQDYYSEKIWRLPQSYIAVDGFEVGVPTLKRENLNIPEDAIVYFSGQGGCKRHPDTVRLQMRILKAVPNSYLLIKGLADEKAIQNFFNEIAIAEGVEPKYLRFLPMVSSEATHRANLGIADVVLDTYPYNGATTTLETLWMGIPLVTKVGEQFVARNSYTMMMNVGIKEGISWSDEEYLEWGIRLGKDAKLRQDIAWKLHQSRQTAPLWNAKQFTCEMEKAYQQMWVNYINAE